MAGKLFVFMGVHASGKRLIISQLADLGVNIVPIYTTATKKNRDAQLDLIYHHVDTEEYSKRNFIINMSYKGEYYGIEKDDLFNAILMHKLSATILDARATKTVKNIIKDHLETIFIMSDYQHIVERMVKAGETKENIRYHLEYADINDEFSQYKVADHVVKNTFSFEKTLNQVLSIMGIMKRPTFEELKTMINEKRQKK